MRAIVRNFLKLLFGRINGKYVYLLDIKLEDIKIKGPQSFLHYVTLLSLLQKI